MDGEDAFPERWWFALAVLVVGPLADAAAASARELASDSSEHRTREQQEAVHARGSAAGRILVKLAMTCRRLRDAAEEAWTLALQRQWRGLSASKPDGLGVFLRRAVTIIPSKVTVAVARAMPLPLDSVEWGSILYHVSRSEAATALVLETPRPTLTADQLSSALGSAVRSGVVASVRMLADLVAAAGPNPKAFDSALRSAVHHDRAAAAQELLSRLDKGHSMFKLVMEATVLQRPAMLKLMVAARKTKTREVLDMALWVAAAHDLVDAARALVELGANVHLSVEEHSSLYTTLTDVHPPNAPGHRDRDSPLAGFGQAGMPKAPRPLHLAARRGSIAMLELLLDNGAASSRQIVVSAVTVAAMAGRFEAVALLRQRSPDDAEVLGANALAAAACIREPAKAVACLLRLLEDGVDVNADRSRALRAVAADPKATAEAAQFLLERGADVNANDGEAVCSASSCRTDTQVLRLLLDSGADVHARNDEPLRGAIGARERSVEVVGLLLDRGANANLEDGALLVPAARHTEVLALLLRRGANARSAAGAKALAATYDVKQVRLLLEHGADVNANNGEAMTAAVDWSRIQSVQAMVEMGTPSRTVLDAAAKFALDRHKSDIYEYLVKVAGSNVDPGGKALVDEVRCNHVKDVERLLQLGADVHFDDDLAMACSTNLAISRLLLEHGADPTARNGVALANLAKMHPERDVLPLVQKCVATFGAKVHMNNHRMFCLAVAAGHREIAGCLLSCGADPNANDGEPLISTGKRGDGLSMAQLLLAHGADARRYGAAALRAQYEMCAGRYGWYGHDGREDAALALTTCLAAAGVDVAAEDNGLLGAAAQAGLARVVAYLLDRGANVHTRNDVALREAVKRKMLPLVGQLLEAGADVRVNGGVVLRMAERYRDDNLIALLKQYDTGAPAASDGVDEPGAAAGSDSGGGAQGGVGVAMTGGAATGNGERRAAESGKAGKSAAGKAVAKASVAGNAGAKASSSDAKASVAGKAGRPTAGQVGAPADTQAADDAEAGGSKTRSQPARQAVAAAPATNTRAASRRSTTAPVGKAREAPAGKAPGSKRATGSAARKA